MNEEEITQPSSPSEEETITDPVDPTLGGEQDAPGKKSAEARIHEILAKNKQLESELQGIKERLAPPPPPMRTPDPTLADPQVKQAAEVLKQMGFVHKDELQQRDQMIKERMALDSEHQRLESMYSGQDGRPKYSRSDVENYMRQNGIFGSPELAYKSMNEAELLDWNMKQSSSKKPIKATAIRPGFSTGLNDDKTITREKLSDVQNNPTPENRLWYERNREKILDLMHKGQL